MAYISVCKLCNSENVELRDSHIIPEFLFKNVYTSKHKFIPIEVDGIDGKVHQKGFRENLLCQGCETKLSLWERELSLFMHFLSGGKSNVFSLTTVGSNTVVEGINYDLAKKALISILWRMSISTLQFFADYDIGIYEERFRNWLHQDLPFDIQDFPILVSKGYISGIYQTGLLMPITQGSYGKHIKMESVVLDGVIFDFLLTDGNVIPIEVELFSLHPEGRVIIQNKEYSEYGIDLSSFSRRVKDKDVLDFFSKHD
ncbi:hypothetical protein [Pseudoalteromonas phenolica]|uniref:hypothetical protein n=1 Tax=Pseudoalteromonas phenolica TaxID=161398 RepID=UPI00110B4A95|nr:hypothetical protein [Pseudoalteromonas phenolica]TMO56363.1 hypothetical protein CWC21_06585 [Pseudoalteromonas phenolica]